MYSSAVDGLDPFDLLDSEAARLDAHFTLLHAGDWDRPSRAEGWSVRDVLAHLAGEELYNHACLNDDMEGFILLLHDEGVQGLEAFNQWSVETRRDLPVSDVLTEWRAKSSETRRRMRDRGYDGSLVTRSGPYSVGFQTLHYASEYATHADDIGAPVEPGEREGRTAWRARVGILALSERGTGVFVRETKGGYHILWGAESADLSPDEFVAATTARLPNDHALSVPLREALIALA
ncbi:maleylpyruvate isomerase family mycothiol-dependent enzyme [Actinomadura flavalba]|uniref:maleylpyruvate isomerase family mycothiol-dependent enzyme n=1 Tax=Actinomadura flavalba TaxID=1120938 RepID=UPI00037802F4|nr:maleylpyruvate isomerase family mycothiol-dependent enzyme [Actinomadura flavalba]